MSPTISKCHLGEQSDSQVKITELASLVFFAKSQTIPLRYLCSGLSGTSALLGMESPRPE
jgi:hypothetical protein